MDTLNRLEHYRDIIETALISYTKIPYAHGQIDIRSSFDRERDQYLIMNVGWDGERRVHSCLIHVEINNGKIWIERDGTEDGIANVLVKAGIPKEQIVLGFRPIEMRPYTEFAIA